MKIFDIDAINQIKLFEKITRTELKDIIHKPDTLIYVVPLGQIGRAIGKKGANIRKLRDVTRKKIKIVEFHPIPELFIKNFISPLKPFSITRDKKVIKIEADRKTKALLIGKNQQNLMMLKKILQEYFGDLEIKIK